ncbi:MAG TPA: CVNH domain-containing protein [Candidatus Angelobacter sp.]|nr:CVNH domain-containing protein [Candidatus Angelobacter sp.]
MRNIIRFGVVALITMAFWNPGTTLSAQGFPSGSYQQTCRNIGVDGSTLHATCQDGNGNWRNSEINFQRCGNDVVNDNGNLRCNSSSGYNNGNNGYRRGDRDRDDRNGNGGYGQNGGPGGSYVQTCRDIRTHGNTLEADCQTGNGQWNRTSLRNYSSCNGGIVNDGGTLRCGGDGGGNYNGNRDRDRDRDWDRDRQGSYQGGGNYQNGAPYGSYQQTCQDIRISGNTLKANCRKGDGHFKQSSLRNFSQCNDIMNENGNLRCK